MRCIVVATDGSPGANRAIDTAVAMAKAIGCELVILTIGGNVTGAELRRLASAEGDLTKALESAADLILTGLVSVRVGVACRPSGQSPDGGTQPRLSSMR